MNEQRRQRISSVLTRFFGCVNETVSELLIIALDEAEAGQTASASSTQRVADRAQTPEGLITAAEAARLLNTSRADLYERVRRNEIPHYKVGRNIRFFGSELFAWAKRHHQ